MAIQVNDYSTSLAIDERIMATAPFSGRPGPGPGRRHGRESYALASRVSPWDYADVAVAVAVAIATASDRAGMSRIGRGVQIAEYRRGE